MTSYPPPPGPGPRVWEVPGRICPCLCSLCVRPYSAYFIILFIPLFTGFPHSSHHPFPYPSFSQTQQYSLCSSKYFSNSNPRAPPGDQRGSITGYPSWPELALLLHFLLGFPFSRPSSRQSLSNSILAQHAQLSVLQKKAKNILFYQSSPRLLVISGISLTFAYILRISMKFMFTSTLSGAETGSGDSTPGSPTQSVLLHVHTSFLTSIHPSSTSSTSSFQ